jgi:hypothetical protein
MNTKLLVDAIVRQTTILIAQLCTAAGVRAPLAQIADQVFLGLAREIEAQGVGRKVAADMFGLALRSYQKKVQRLAESETLRDKTLWEVVIDFIREQGGSTSRRRIFERFKNDDEDALAAILNDLVSSGLAYATGRGASALYGLTSLDDQARMAHEDQAGTLPALIWLLVYREGPLTPAALEARLGLESELVQRIVHELDREGRIARDPGGRLRSGSVTIAVGERAGWEAAVLDHFQAVAKAIASKVRLRPQSQQADVIGGATLSFDVATGHPHEAEVYAILREVRVQLNELWARVTAHNKQNPIADVDRVKVTFYIGQNVERPGSEAPPSGPISEEPDGAEGAPPVGEGNEP